MMPPRIGKYERVRKLGQGSMGEVFLATDPVLGRPVAIKTILQGSDFGDEGTRRFEREAKALAALNHPNIVTLYDFGIDGGTLYLAMEFLDGVDLATAIERGDPDRAGQLEVLAQACEALALAHSRGMVHRDVKPSNIMVLRRGDRVQAKLMDFGIASVERSNLTARDSWMGTVHYMAPEYLDSGKATAACDLFAAGVILYEILSGGGKPFEGDTPTAVLGAILRQEPLPLAPEVLAATPPPMLKVLARALAKDPGQRFGDGEAMAEAIRGAAGAPLQAPVPAQGPDPVPARGPAPGRVLVVGRGAGVDCMSLRVALRQAEPGATIRVLPGAYREHLRIDKPVVLRGDGGAGEVLLPEGITVAGGASLTMAGLQVGHREGPALRLEAGAKVLAEEVCFEAAAAGGAELAPGSEARFRRCRFQGSLGAGLLALEGAQAELEDCELAGNRDAGLHACGRAQVTLRGCRLVDNTGLGASAVDGAALVLEGCRLARNHEPGVFLARGATVRLQRCEITEGRSLGVLALDGTVLALEACRVAGNARGGVCLPREARAAALGPGNRIEDALLDLEA